MPLRGMAAKQPERFINRSLLLQAVVLMVVHSISVVMLLWSTVVLLGGFVSVLTYTDFCYITLMSLIQMAKVFNVLIDEQYMFFFNALLKPISRCIRCARRRLKNSRNVTLQPSLGDQVSPKCSLFRRLLSFKTTMYLLMDTLLMVALVFVVFHPVLVLYFSIVLSLSRLRKGDFSEPPVPILDVSCKGFYGLALAQGTIYIIWHLISLSNVALKRHVASKCNFDHRWGLEAINRYFSHTQSMSLKDLLLTRDWDMIRFGVDLLDSEMDTDYVLGARLVDFFIGKSKDLVQKLRSPKKIQKLVNVLAWKQRNDHDRELRMLTLKVLAHVSEDLCISQFPGLLQRLTCLFELGGKGECLLMQQGLLVLEGLAKDKENCRLICNNEALLGHIAQLVFSQYSRNGVELIDWIKTQNSSLKMLKCLIVDHREVSPLLCEKIGCKLDAATISFYTDFPEMQLSMIDIWTHIFISCPSNDTEAIKSFVAFTLPSFLTSEGEAVTNDLAVKPELQEKAGRSLCMLSMRSKHVCEAILLVEEDISAKLIGLICLPNKMLHQVIAAEIFQNICFHCDINFSEEMLEKVIQLIAGTETQENEDPHQIQVQIDPPGDMSYDAQGLQAALLSTIAAVYAKGLIKGEAFARVVCKDAQDRSFMRILKQMVDRSCSNTGYGIDIVKACATLVGSILRYNRQKESLQMCNQHWKLLKQIKDNHIIDSLCLASRRMKIFEISMTGAREKKSLWETPLQELVKVCVDASAQKVEETS